MSASSFKTPKMLTSEINITKNYLAILTPSGITILLMLTFWYQQLRSRHFVVCSTFCCLTFFRLTFCHLTFCHSTFCHFNILLFDILSFDILLFDILSFDTLSFDILSFDILSFQHFVVRHFVVWHFVVWHFVVWHFVVWHFVIRHFVVWHWNVDPLIYIPANFEIFSFVRHKFSFFLWGQWDRSPRLSATGCGIACTYVHTCKLHHHLPTYQ
jgi:hypothetical protein